MEVIFIGMIVAAIAAAARHLWITYRERKVAAEEAKRKREEAITRFLQARLAARSTARSTTHSIRSARGEVHHPYPCGPGDSLAQPLNFGGFPEPESSTPAYSGGGGTFDGGGASGDWGGSSSSDSCSSSDSGSCGSSD